MSLPGESRTTLRPARRGALLGALLGVVGTLLVPASVDADPSWLLPAVRLSDAAVDSFEADVAVDAAGNTTAVWLAELGVVDQVVTSYRPAGGAWSPPAAISQGATSASAPAVEVDHTGGAIVAWQTLTGPTGAVWSSSRSGGAWSGPVQLSGGGTEAHDVRLAMNPAGAVVVVWAAETATTGVVQGLVRNAAGTWTTAAILSDPSADADAPDVAIDPSGRATAVWSREGAPTVVQTASHQGSGGWTAPVTVSQEPQDATGPQVAAAADGAAVVIWRRDTGTKSVLRSARRTPGGSWGLPVDVTDGVHEVARPRLALGPGGLAVAAWDRNQGGYGVVQTASETAAGVWGVPVDLSEKAAWVDMHVGVDAAGRTTVAWSEFNQISSRVHASSRAPGGAWTPAPLSSPGAFALSAALAVDPSGNAVAVWKEHDGAHEVVVSTTLDGAGPMLSALSVPVHGYAGKDLAFSVAPADAWSPPGTSTWSFGDGTSLPGNAVTHRFAEGGTFTVTVTATDALGNASTATAQVTVTGRPVLGKVALSRKKIQVDGPRRQRRTRLRFTVSTDADVRVRITPSGRKHHGPAVTLHRQLEPGARTITLRSRMSGKELRPATYAVKVRATNPAGSGRQHTVRLVVRP